MIYDNIVIGSGISALGCVVGLLESNKKILCIDGSDNTLESFKNINNEEIVQSTDGERSRFNDQSKRLLLTEQLFDLVNLHNNFKFLEPLKTIRFGKEHSHAILCLQKE